MQNLIGLKVMNRKTKQRGIIVSQTDTAIEVDHWGDICVYPYPSSFAETLIIEDSSIQEELETMGAGSSFQLFCARFRHAIRDEITYLKVTGGKKYRIIDGELISSNGYGYTYSFDTDTELHFPDGTEIKLWFPEKVILAYVISCEDYSIIFRVSESLGTSLESVEFSAEPWQLIESLIDRMDEIEADHSRIAYEIACKGRDKIREGRSLVRGQDEALKRGMSQPITFIWGPPGTGKTTTLAKIASQYLERGKRVLMLSYSNVSVDGALLRVARTSDAGMGQIIRYGYPRTKELLESKYLTSYAYVLYRNPKLASEYQELQTEKKKLKRKDPRSIEITKELGKIRAKLADEEKELVQKAAFVATTVSKAVVDKTIYCQKFDVVIFDEASMAYVPQIVFAASLAKSHFCCLGDFRQLPAIVQNPNDEVLTEDIFEYTGITSAVDNNIGHEWLVMLDQQYRMHPVIASFASTSMYQGLLKSPDSIYKHKQLIADCYPMPGEPIGMMDLSGTYSVCIKTMDGSRINLLSAMICIKLAELFVDYYEVGIITPYSAQARLILAMIRDLQERDKRYKTVSCATVHQFQGSEKAIIIYDAVDCYRMPYPGMLLTQKKNNSADRLFNVAITRTQGKFILVANRDYMKKKKLSSSLMFAKAIELMKRKKLVVQGDELYAHLGTPEEEYPEVFCGDRDEVDSWERYITDISHAKRRIAIDLPGVIDDDEDALEELEEALIQAEENGAKITIRRSQDILLPEFMEKYEKEYGYVTTPFSIIDEEIIWFGEPLSSADFIAEGDLLLTELFLCMRFRGKITARMLKAIYELTK